MSTARAHAEYRADDPLGSLPYMGDKWATLWTGLAVAGSLLLTESRTDRPPWSPEGRGFASSRATWLHSIRGDRTDVWGGELGFGGYAREWLSLCAEGALLRARDERVRTGAFRGLLLARFHPLTRRHASLLFEYGAGLALFGEPFPPGGTRVNFAPTYGLASLIRVREGAYLHLGLRHQHFSNAGVLGGGNPGFDSNGVSVGFEFRG